MTTNLVQLIAIGLSGREPLSLGCVRVDRAGAMLLEPFGYHRSCTSCLDALSTTPARSWTCGWTHWHIP